MPRVAHSAQSKKAKGARLENRLAKKLREAQLDPGAKRMPGSGAFKDFKSDIFSRLPISWECKNTERWDFTKFYDQASRDCRPGHTPVVVVSRNNDDDYAFLRLDDLIYFLQLAKETGELVPELPFSKRKQLGK